MAKKSSFSKTLKGKEAEKKQAIQELTGQAPKSEGDDELVPFNLKVPRGIKNAFQETCERTGPTMTWVIIKAMKQYIKDNEE